MSRVFVRGNLYPSIRFAPARKSDGRSMQVARHAAAAWENVISRCSRARLCRLQRSSPILRPHPRRPRYRPGGQPSLGRAGVGFRAAHIRESRFRWPIPSLWVVSWTSNCERSVPRHGAPTPADTRLRIAGRHPRHPPGPTRSMLARSKDGYNTPRRRRGTLEALRAPLLRFHRDRVILRPGQ